MGLVTVLYIAVSATLTLMVNYTEISSRSGLPAALAAKGWLRCDFDRPELKQVLLFNVPEELFKPDFKVVVVNALRMLVHLA